LSILHPDELRAVGSTLNLESLQVAVEFHRLNGERTVAGHGKVIGQPPKFDFVGCSIMAEIPEAHCREVVSIFAICARDSRSSQSFIAEIARGSVAQTKIMAALVCR
jgi:hypothetical protein